MSWNLPDLPTGGITVATVANWATKVIDSLKHLHGNDGTVTLSDGLDLGANEFTVNSIEIVGADGEVNKVAVEDHTHANTANCGQLDYGTALVGAGDTRGDILYRNATTWARLPKGTAGQYLSIGANDPIWISGTTVSGGIIMWAGTIANIPTGHIICDGNNSTPNLLARFVQGVATAATNPGTTGGATAKTTAGHTTPSHTLTTTEMPAHTHDIPLGLGAASASTASRAGATTGDYGAQPASAGGGGGHTHSSVTDSIADIRPLFFDLAFLLKT